MVVTESSVLEENMRGRMRREELDIGLGQIRGEGLEAHYTFGRQRCTLSFTSAIIVSLRIYEL